MLEALSGVSGIFFQPMYISTTSDGSIDDGHSCNLLQEPQSTNSHTEISSSMVLEPGLQLKLRPQTLIWPSATAQTTETLTALMAEQTTDTNVA